MIITHGIYYLERAVSAESGGFELTDAGAWPVEPPYNYVPFMTF